MKTFWSKIVEFFKVQKWAKWVALGLAFVGVGAAAFVVGSSVGGKEEGSAPESSVEESSSVETHTHKYVEAIIKAFDCVSAGEKVYSCSCGDNYMVIIPSLGHDSVNDVCTYCGRKISKGLEYELSGNDEYYIVKGIGTCTDMDLVIPSIHNGLPVKSIGDNAFRECSRLTSVFIPDSVTSVGAWGFSNCNSLTSVVIPNSVTSIFYCAFAYCGGLTSITFNGTVAQWNGIEKGGAWNLYVPATKVVCKNGKVALS